MDLQPLPPPMFAHPSFIWPTDISLHQHSAVLGVSCCKVQSHILELGTFSCPLSIPKAVHFTPDLSELRTSTRSSL